MAQAERDYSRLSRLKGVGLASRHSLWLGRDHILSLFNYYSFEDYKRFYFSDIQAIVVCKTARRTVWNIVRAVLVGVSAGVFLMGGEFGQRAGAFLLVAFLLVLIIELALGPTCVCQLRTAAHTEQLPSIGRLRAARNLIARIRPLIESAQGHLTLEELAAIPRAQTTSASSVSGDEIDQPEETKVPPLRGYRGGFHALTFGLLLVAGSLAFIALYHQNLFMILMELSVAVAIIICAVVAAVKQHSGHSMGKVLKGLIYATLGYMFAVFLIGCAYMVLLSAQNPEALGNQWELLKYASSLSSQE